MINSLSKALFFPQCHRSYQSLMKKISQNFCRTYIFHNLEIQSISEKWYVEFNYNFGTFVLNEQQQVKQIRPYSYPKVFVIKLVEKNKRFVKGRNQYKIQFLPNEIMKLAEWSPSHGKFQIVHSNQYREDVFFVQKVIKQKSEEIERHFEILSKPRSYPLTLYRFNYYNNKLQTEKSKEFFLRQGEFNLLQQTIKQSFEAISFFQNKQEYEIWKLEQEITNKNMMIINRPTQ